MSLYEKLLVRITIDPSIMVGKPVIKGTRIPVQQILDALAQGMSFEEVEHEYPNITNQDILACLAFASQTLAQTTFSPLSLS